MPDFLPSVMQQGQGHVCNKHFRGYWSKLVHDLQRQLKEFPHQRTAFDSHYDWEEPGMLVKNWQKIVFSIVFQ